MVERASLHYVSWDALDHGMNALGMGPNHVRCHTGTREPEVFWGPNMPKMHGALRVEAKDMQLRYCQEGILKLSELVAVSSSNSGFRRHVCKAAVVRTDSMEEPIHDCWWVPLSRVFGVSGCVQE